MLMARRETSIDESMLIFPNAQPEIFAHFGDPYLTDPIAGGTLSPLSPISVLAPRFAPYRHSCGQKVDWFLIQLTPLGCRAILGAPIAALGRTDMALEVYCGKAASHLFEPLAGAGRFETKCAIAEDWLTERLIEASPREQYLSALVTLARHRPVTSVQRLGKALDIGHRRLRQVFHAEIGVSPKQFLSLMRAERLWTQLHPWSASEAGLFDEFADQSHAAREFRHFTGLTMGEYRRAKADGDGLINGVRPSID